MMTESPDHPCHSGSLPVDPSPAGEDERAMIWSEYDAYLLQVKQIGTSACGATAVINVLVSIIKTLIFA